MLKIKSSNDEKIQEKYQKILINIDNDLINNKFSKEELKIRIDLIEKEMSFKYKKEHESDIKITQTLSIY